MNFASIEDTIIVSGMVITATSVTPTLYFSIMTTAPMMVMTPEKSDVSDCEIADDTLSISFVMRLIMSPWRCVSVYFIGSLSSFSNSSRRMK